MTKDLNKEHTHTHTHKVLHDMIINYNKKQILKKKKKKRRLTIEMIEEEIGSTSGVNNVNESGSSIKRPLCDERSAKTPKRRVQMVKALAKPPSRDSPRIKRPFFFWCPYENSHNITTPNTSSKCRVILHSQVSPKPYYASATTTATTNIANITATSAAAALLSMNSNSRRRTTSHGFLSFVAAGRRRGRRGGGGGEEHGWIVGIEFFALLVESEGAPTNGCGEDEMIGFNGSTFLTMPQ